MLLTIDIGNTNISFGVYQGEKIKSSWRVSTEQHRMPDEYGLQIEGLLKHADFSPGDISGICLASVVPPLTDVLIEACREYLFQEPLVVTQA